MLIEQDHFDADNAPPEPTQWCDDVFRRCSFDGLDIEGIIFDGILENCAFTRCELYWGLFNVALVSGTRFEACRFRSTSFRSCTFVDCEFVDCTFELDNLGSDCTIDDCLMAACRFNGCTWINKQGRDRRDITKTRWLACPMTNCTGFDGMI